MLDVFWLGLGCANAVKLKGIACSNSLSSKNNLIVGATRFEFYFAHRDSSGGRSEGWNEEAVPLASWLGAFPPVGPSGFARFSPVALWSTNGTELIV